MDYRSRQARLGAVMARQRLQALLVTHLPDVRYLCGFTGSNAALVVLTNGSSTRAHLFTDGRYTAQAASEVNTATVRIAKKNAFEQAVVFAANSPAERCGYDPVFVTVQTLATMRKALRSEALKVKRTVAFLKASGPLVSGLREVKDAEEIARLRSAAALGCELYEGMLGWIETGVREIDVAAELEYRARKAGAEAMSFETIVASGVRSSMPHAGATAATLHAGSLLTLDFGIMLDGYCSDMTRTVFLAGQATGQGVSRTTAEQRTVYEAVLEAQMAAVSAVRDGVSAGAVDYAARSVLENHGLAKYFSHSTGHGLGLEIHEAPRVAATQTTLLKTGNVITIEPGAYLPGRFGVRIEDTVVVTDTGCEILTSSYKGWIEL